MPKVGQVEWLRAKDEEYRKKLGQLAQEGAEASS
jgi:hypothetical protein